MNNILDIYNNTSENKKEEFNSSINSSLTITKNSNSHVYDDEWITKMEKTIRYLDNILRNPNRFIVNEEEIVKIELARRITVDSIKHLSRNTNLIQKFDPKTNEVKPSKILNINKEESFNTYENRFIFTLINNMKMYIERKKTEDISDGSQKEFRSFDYKGKTKVGNEKIELSLNLKSNLEENSKNGNSISDRVSKLEEKIADLCSSSVYKDIARLHVAPVVSPIKKTNLILKNVNFQYALELWNYMQTHMEPSSKNDNQDATYEEKGVFKDMMNDSFMLNYLIMKSMDKKPEPVEQEELKNKVATNTVKQLLNISDQLSLEEVMKLIGDKYVKVKYKKVLDTSSIAAKYKEAIDMYMAKEHELGVKENEEDDE